jgi:hypothetical protein
MSKYTEKIKQALICGLYANISNGYQFLKMSENHLHICPVLFPQIGDNFVPVPLTLNVSFLQSPRVGPIIWKLVNSKYNSVACSNF